MKVCAGFMSFPLCCLHPEDLNALMSGLFMFKIRLLMFTLPKDCKKKKPDVHSFVCIYIFYLLAELFKTRRLEILNPCKQVLKKNKNKFLKKKSYITYMQILIVSVVGFEKTPVVVCPRGFLLIFLKRQIQSFLALLCSPHGSYMIKSQSPRIGLFPFEEKPVNRP